MKLDNKGFAVSMVLYTLLIIFMLFLLVALATFNNSFSLISSANDNIVNGTKFSVEQIVVNQKDSSGNVVNNCTNWFTNDSKRKLLIRTSNGNNYWPRDYVDGIYKNNGNITVTFSKTMVSYTQDCLALEYVSKNDTNDLINNESSYYCAKLYNSTTEETDYILLSNICN